MVNYLILFIAAFIVRVSQAGNLFPVIKGDPATYLRLGKAIVQWGVLSPAMLANYPTTDHPIYPLFLGIVFFLFGENYLALLVVQSLIGGLTCILVYRVAKEVFAEKIALIAGAIAVFYPVFVRLANTIMTEQIFIPMFLTSILLFIRYVKTAKSLYLYATGVTLGISTLTRSVAMLFIFVLISYLFYRRKDNLSLACKRSLVFFILIFICTIIPQTIRNYFVSNGDIIPVTVSPTRDLYVAFSPCFNKNIFGTRPEHDPVLIEGKQIASMKERNRFYLEKTKEAILKYPGHVMELEFWKIVFLWSPIDWEILGNGIARYNYGFMFIMPFFILGTVLLIKRKDKLGYVLLLPVLYFQCLHLVYFGLPRFRIGFEPSLIIIAAYGMRDLYCKVQRKGAYLVFLASFLAVNILLFIYSAQTKIFVREIFKRAGLW